MTREEAIAFGEMWLDVSEDCKDSNTYDFFKISIEVLKQRPFINKPCVSSGVCEHDKNTVLDKIRTEIEQLPTTECTETRRIWIRADDFKEEVLKVLHRCTESEE